MRERWRETKGNHVDIHIDIEIITDDDVDEDVDTRCPTDYVFHKDSTILSKPCQMARTNTLSPSLCHTT